METQTLRQLDFRAMGCAMHVALAAAEPTGDDPLEAVPVWFETWEGHLSRFRADSELSQLNDAAGRPTLVSTVLWEVLEAALDAAAWTGGLVSPTLLAEVEAAGYDRSFEGIAGRAAGPAGAGHRPATAPYAPVAGTGRPGARRQAAASWRKVRLDDNERRVTVPAGVRLDLGGIAKGWAADEAARRLAVHGPALVDAGGDIALSGPLPGHGRWPVAIADPFAPDRHAVVLWLDRGGIATSGRDYRRWRREGQWQHHIIDPRTGQPATTDVLTATVVAPTTRRAEAAAKVALILGTRAGLAWIEAHPPLAALLVGDDGEMFASRRLATYLGG